MPMPSREGSKFRPSWRFCYAPNKQKVIRGTPPPLRDVKNEGTSGDVDENKGKHDKMSGEITRIRVELTRIVQKITSLVRFRFKCLHIRTKLSSLYIRLGRPY